MQDAVAPGDTAETLRLSELLDGYNNSGDDIDLPFPPGRATPRESQALPDDPTNPGNCN